MLVSENYIFNFKNLKNDDLKVLKNKINEYLKLSNIEISNDEVINLQNNLKIYNKLFNKIHKENKKSGVYGKFNYQNIQFKLRNKLEKDFIDVNEKLLQFLEILNLYFVEHNNLKNEINTNLRNFIKSKLDEQEYDYFTKIMTKEKINELEKIDRKNNEMNYKNFFGKHHIMFY